MRADVKTKCGVETKRGWWWVSWPLVLVVGGGVALAAAAGPGDTVAVRVAAVEVELPAVALVAALAGDVTACSSAGDRCGERSPATLTRFAWIPEGTRVELAPGATMQLLFLDGRRYELTGPAVAAVGTAGVELAEVPQRSPVAGPALRELPSVVVPEVQAIAAGERPATRLGAVRLRAGGIEGLYPLEGVTTLADATTLSFAPVSSATRYRITVLDPAGRAVFAADTVAALPREAATSVAVPTGRLRPGESYLWRVATLDAIGPVLRGEAEFTTLSTAAANAREELQRALAAGGPAAELVLAEVDRRLGLLAEARRSADAAAALSPQDAALRRAAEEMTRAVARASSP